MKKINLAIVVLFLVSVFFPVAVLATVSRSIHVEWGYTPPSDPAVTGFRLYIKQNGIPVPIANFMGADLRESDHLLMIYSSFTPVLDFTLTALFADGTESPHSAPFPFSVEEYLPVAPMEAVQRLTKNKPYPNLRSGGKSLKMIFLGDESSGKGELPGTNGQISGLKISIKKKA